MPALVTSRRDVCIQRRRCGPARRGSVVIAVVIALVIVAIAVSGAVLGGAVSAQGGMLAQQGVKARFAAEAAANMAVQELMDNVDTDGDGTIGSISNDSNTATDPLISGTRIWATKTTSAGTTTVVGRGANAAADAAVQVDLTGSGVTTAGTVMLVVLNSGSLNAQETAKRTLIEGWGYTVAPISEGASQAAFDAAAAAASAAYISETVNSGTVSTKLTNFTIGVVTEESALADELGFATANTAVSASQINVTSGTHYITSTIGTGVKSMFNSAQPVRYLSGTLGGGTTLATQPATANPTLSVMERGATLSGGGTAAGRRVYLPFGNTGMDINQLSADGLTLMRRSIEWCILPVAWYKLDDAAGTTAADAVAARNGTLTSGPVWTASGRVNGGLTFDGVDDYVTIPNAPAFQVTRAMSICGWIRQTAAWPTGSTVCIILRKGEDNPNNWELAICNGRAEFVLDTSDDTGVKGATTLTLNAWHHVAATWDGTTIRVYLDGVLDMTPVARSTAIGTDTRPVYLGGRAGATDVTRGTVDDVRFYNRALTAGEVAAIAAGGKPTVTGWSAIAP